MNACSHFLDVLARGAHSDGGWGYAPGQRAQLEPTCLALLALSLDPAGHAAVIERGQKFLDQWATSDGAFRLAHGREEAIWPTALVLFTRLTLGRRDPALEKSAGYLLALKGMTPENLQAGEMHDIDMKLVGWPWAENNFSWVEPTSWACLALRAAGQEQHPRVQEGLHLLLDRAMDEGGINYGNRRILGKLTEPIPGPTALMLLAVQGLQHPRIDAAVHYLRKECETSDLEHLCWAKLALSGSAQENDLGWLNDRITSSYQEREKINWLRPAFLRVALCALALGADQRNFFRLSEQLPAANGVPIPACCQRQRGFGQRLGSWFRGLAVKAAGLLKQPPALSAVHIAHAPSYDDDLAALVREQYQHFREQVPLAGKRVVLKPNLVEYHRNKVINTDPRVVSAAIELCKQEGAREIIVAEGPGHWRNVEYLVAESGLGDVLRDHGVPFVDLNHDEPVKTPNLGLLTGLEYLYLSRTIATADVVISLPKLKTHHWAGATLSLKNLFGTLPGICYGWPKNELHWRGIDNSIVDIALTRTPELAIVDGIVGMEGDGPLNGTARPMGALVMGHDLVAVDATCCRLMMLDPAKIAYLVLGAAKKLGRLNQQDIPQLGAAIAELARPFDTVDHLRGLKVKQSA